MASPALRSKIPLPLLFRRAALTGQQQSVADLGTALVRQPVVFSPKEVVSPPPQSFVSIGKDSLLGSGNSWAFGSEDGFRLAGRRRAVQDEDEDGEVDHDWDMSEDDLKDLDDDSEDFDDDDDSEDDEDVPRRKSK